ncbi:MAG: tetratricopeptide repeat protein [Bacteroidales bacterium]|nr:tetratricopeptide repeat protein [Bacteroidales bacterium]
MKKLLLCLALSVVFFPLFAQEEKRDSIAVENALLDVVAHIEAGDFEIAGASLDSLLADHPENDAIRYYKGLCSISAGDYKDAGENFRKALELDPSNAWYKETLANLYLNTGEVKEAEKLLRELQLVNPGKFPEISVSTMLAASYRMKRDFPSYFAALRSLVSDNVADDDMKYEAMMSVMSGFDSRTFNALLPQIDTLLRVYVEAEPKSMHARGLMIETAHALGDDERVIEICQEMMELQPEDTTNVVSCLSIIGDTYHSMGQTRKAYKTYEKALKLDPRNCPVLNNYAYYLSLEKRRLAKAEKMSFITIEEEPDNPTYLDTYGWILFLRGKAKQAKPYFKHAMLYGGKDNAVILMHFSQVLEKLGEKDLATYYRTLSESKTK